MKPFLKSGSFWFSALAVTFLVAGVVASKELWGWLHPTGPMAVSNGETLRNVGLLIGGGLAFIFAGWRAWVAERQANAARRQAEISQHQVEIVQGQVEASWAHIEIARGEADIARQSLQNDRYQRAAEMLGSNVLIVRIRGIYALDRLAREFPAQYHLLTMELLCKFVQLSTSGLSSTQSTPTYNEESEETSRLRADLQEAMRAIGLRGSQGYPIEQAEKDFKLYLRGADIGGVELRKANLSGAWLTKANLSRAVLPYADLSGARLRVANLSGAKLRYSDLSEAVFWGADLSEAVLWKANLSGTDFCGARARSAAYRTPAYGLTQVQLDEAWADPANPPRLNGILDAITDEPLVWHGKPCAR